jgi:tetratricopeptide (TPR) repeat protein
MIALVIAALLAQQVVVKPGGARREGPSLRDRVGSAVRKLYEKPEPHVVEGNARAAHGDADGALMEYERAQVPEHGPQAAALAHDKASALLRAGDAQLAARAIAEANHALAEGDPQLKAKAAYDLGYALEQSGRPDDAIAAYARALEYDPSDRDAKVNLELLLREEQRKKRQPQASGQKESEKKQPAKSEARPPPSQADKAGPSGQQRAPAQQSAEPRKNPSASDRAKDERGEPSQGDPRLGNQGENKELQAAGNRPMDRSESQRLLDALRAGEKNLQVWRFGKQRSKERRLDVEKDW